MIVKLRENVKLLDLSLIKKTLSAEIFKSLIVYYYKKIIVRQLISKTITPRLPFAN